MTTIATIQENELDRVREFYKAAGYGGGVSPADLTLGAKLDDRLIGVVRLCDEEGVTVLRGMQVLPAFQLQGVGLMLLEHCVPHLDRGAAYCLPYDHLVRFYGRAGFKPAAADELPAFLARRLSAYITSGQKVLAMRRG